MYISSSIPKAELNWCKQARAMRLETVRYFGTLAPEATNTARTVGHLYPEEEDA